MLPRPDRGMALNGFFRSSFYLQGRANKGLKVTIPPEALDKLEPDDGAQESFQPWPNKSFKYLMDWEAKDYERLNIPPMVKSTGKNESSRVFREVVLSEDMPETVLPEDMPKQSKTSPGNRTGRFASQNVRPIQNF